MSKKENNRRHKHKPINHRNLLIATLMNLVITIAEIAGGIISNSLALLSDALHNLSDTFATFIAYMAALIGKREATQKNTFGYKRVEILAAMLNAVILIIICLYLFKEAYVRINNPEPINSMVMIIVAVIGLVANVLAVTLLRPDSKKNINVRAAYVHLIGDSLSSVLVIVAAIAIKLFEIYWIDPIISILIGLYLIRESFLILKEAVNILMQSAPEHVDIKRIQNKIEKLPDVKNIHHLHVWNLTENDIHLDAHIEVNENMSIHDLQPLQQNIEEILIDKFNIQHTTLQFEYFPDHSKKLIPKSE